MKRRTIKYFRLRRLYKKLGITSWHLDWINMQNKKPEPNPNLSVTYIQVRNKPFEPVLTYTFRKPEENIVTYDPQNNPLTEDEIRDFFTHENEKYLTETLPKKQKDREDQIKHIFDSLNKKNRKL